jgi:uncharacterized protein YdaT
MGTGKQYFVEPAEGGGFAVKAEGAKKASAILQTQKEAIEKAKEFNPEKKPHVARVRQTNAGHPDQFEKK